MYNCTIGTNAPNFFFSIAPCVVYGVQRIDSPADVTDIAQVALQLCHWPSIFSHLMVNSALLGTLFLL
jgi:hypothetical protein